MWEILLQGLKDEMSEFVFNVFKEKIRGIFLFREDTELKAWKQNSPNNHFCVTFLVMLLVVDWSKEKVTLSIGILKINSELSQHESGLCCGSWRCWWCAGGSNWLRLALPFARGWGLHPLQLLQAGWCWLRQGRTAGCSEVNYCLFCRIIDLGGKRCDTRVLFQIHSCLQQTQGSLAAEESSLRSDHVRQKSKRTTRAEHPNKLCLCPVGSLIERVPLHI